MASVAAGVAAYNVNAATYDINYAWGSSFKDDTKNIAEMVSLATKRIRDKTV